jgi:hypothetical protein
MRAHDGQGRKIPMQILYIGQQPVLDVEDHGLGAIPSHIVPQFLAGADYMNRKVRAESTSQSSGHFRIFLKNDYALRHNSPESSTVVNGGRRHWTRAAGWLGKPLHHRHLKLSNRGQKSPRLTGGQATSLSALRMVQLEASRSSSAESRPYLPPVPVLSGRKKRAACLLQTVSEISPKGLLPFPVPELFSPVAGGTLQTWPTGFRSVSYCNAPLRDESPVFLMRRTHKNDR